MDRASDTTKRSAVCSLVLSAGNLESFIGPQVISSSLYGCVQCINTIYPGLGNEFVYYLISKSLACVETYGSSPTLKAAFQSQCIFGPYKNVSASRIPLSIHFLSTLTVVTYLPLIVLGQPLSLVTSNISGTIQHCGQMLHILISPTTKYLVFALHLGGWDEIIPNSALINLCGKELANYN